MSQGTGTLTVVVGGQYGSEAKGHVAARLAREERAHGRAHVGVRVAGPNAGHTAYDETGHRFAFRQLPVAAVTNPDADLVLSAGSEVEYDVLRHEVEWAERVGHKVRDRLYIDAQATVLTEAHKQAEMFGQMQAKLGSTQKGIGAARADRIMRKATLVGDRIHQESFEQFGAVCDTASLLRSRMTEGADVLIEGTQGYGLGLHAGYYPKCTSSDARAIDFLAMAGISPWDRCVSGFSVLVVARVYPIRVAGNSGPLVDETTWEKLGLEPEYTTVTKKVRRVGGWDPGLVRAAVEANGGSPVVKVVVTMLDQKFPGVAGLDGRLDQEMARQLAEAGASDWLDGVQAEVGAPVVAVGTGPNTMVLA